MIGTSFLDKILNTIYNPQFILLSFQCKGSLAQPVEQRTFNPLVERSNRSRPTKL